MNSTPSSRTQMGVNGDSSAWVIHTRYANGAPPARTEYRVAPRQTQAEYLPADYDVSLVQGPDVLDHDEVRRCAHDAFLDAFGGC